MPERSYGLRMSILIDIEIALVEARYNMLLVVDHGGVQHDFFNLFAENKRAVVGIRILSCTGGSFRLAARSAHTLTRRPRRLRVGKHHSAICRVGSRVDQKKRCDGKNNRQRKFIPSAHSSPSWRRPSVAAIPSVAPASP